MLSLTFALLRSYTALNFWQVMVAVMSIDITSAVVQMTLSQKDTLASRWWVVLNAISQILVNVSIGVVLGKTFPIPSARQDPSQTCVRVVWWGTFDSCDKVPWTFWLYWIVRTLLVMRSCAIGLHHMHFYDFGERIARGEKSSQEVSWSSHVLRLLTFTDLTKDITMTQTEDGRENTVWSLEAFPRMPATTLTDWVLWTLPAFVAVISLERMLVLFDLSNPCNIEDWGQTTTFMAVICGLVARAIYLFYAKLKRRSCFERTKAAAEFCNVSTAQKIQPSTEDFVSLASKFKSFRQIQKVLQPVDCVRRKLPKKIWYQHIDSEEAETEFLRSAVLNDINGLIEWGQYISELSTTVDQSKKTALHIALENNNIEAIETIVDLIDSKSQPGRSPSTEGDLEKLLTAPDNKNRTPWGMIWPAEGFDQLDRKTVAAILRFKHPVMQPGKSAPLSQIINGIFEIPYSLEVMELWADAAKKTRSLRQLEEHIIQAVAIDPYSHTEDSSKWAKRVWKFWRRQHDIRRTPFTDRLFKAFMDSSVRYSVHMPANIASFLAQFVQENQVWAMESYTNIARIVSSGHTLDDVRILIKHHPQYPQIEEYVLLGAVSNRNISLDLVKMMLKEWPDQMDITPKVLEALLADKSVVFAPYILKLFLEECSYQIEITESMLMFVAKRSNTLIVEIWEVLLEKYRSSIKMTQDIFIATVSNIGHPAYPHVIDVLTEILNEWPSETKITNKTLLSLTRKPENAHEDLLQLLHELRRDELKTAIDSQVLVLLVETSRWGNRQFVDFFFRSYPEECKASITDEVVEKIDELETQGYSKRTFKAFRQALI
jgi:hypothetical protein